MRDLSYGFPAGEDREDPFGPCSKKKAKLKKNVTFLLFFIAALICPVKPSAQELKPVKLPSPQMEKGRPLMQALKERRSQREFSARELPLQVISDMLWAAFGINRPDSGGRTAPSARNMQEIDIYVVKADGLYLYEAGKNELVQVLTQDIRPMTGKQGFVKDAPVNLVYVADFSRMGNVSDEIKSFYAATDTGFISENVYLYCASEGLATVVRGLFDGGTLAEAMKLGVHQKAILAQTVGYPKDQFK